MTSVTYAGGTYTLTGTQLSGLINGGDEGDDMTMAENYPIVWLTDEAGDVYYCQSFGFSTMMPAAGSTPQTCQFTTPAGLPEGAYDLYVSAVGVASTSPLVFTVGVGGFAGDAGIGSSADAAAGSGDDSSTGSNGDAGGETASPDGSVDNAGDGSIGTGGAGAGGAGATSGVSGSPGCGCRTAKARGLPTPPLVAFVAMALLGALRAGRRGSGGERHGPRPRA